MKISNASSTAIHGIRLLSAQAVLVGHAMVFFGLYPKNIPYIQSIAVTVLFILSGFLTVYSYDNKKQKNPQYRFKDFFIDRFSRIYSAYLPAIIFVVLLDWLMIRFSVGQYDFSNHFNVKTIFANLFMLQDFPLDYYLPGLSLRVSESLGSARPFWTLPIEWWLYMWFGIFIVEYKFSKKRIWFWAIGLFSSLVPVYNILIGRGNGLSVSFILAGLLYYVMQWFLKQGKDGTGAFIQKYKKEYFIAVVSLVVLAAFRVNEVSNRWKMDYDPIMTIFLVAAFGLILLSTQTKEYSVNPRISGSIKVLSSYSYSLYLTHYSVLYWIAAVYKDRINPVLLFAVSVVICNLVGAVFHRLFETQSDRIKSVIQKMLIRPS